jgi:branched-chain amino acid transport system substrate-binding protein
MSSDRRNTLAAVLSALVLAGVAGCGGPPQPASGGRAPDPIRIAVIDPQTGDNSPLGKWEHKGVKLAVDEANKQGGVNGRPIQLAIFDDRGDPAMANKLVVKWPGRATSPFSAAH